MTNLFNKNFLGLLDLLYHLKEPCSAGDAVLLQRWCNGEADGLLRAAQIRHNKVGGHWVEIALHTFHGSVERLEIYRDIGTLRIHLTTSQSCLLRV